MYYNKSLRKTVCHLPGFDSQSVAAATSTKRGLKEERSEESETVTMPHHENTGNEVFVPINFDTAVSIEGHDMQVVHVGQIH